MSKSGEVRREIAIGLIAFGLLIALAACNSPASTPVVTTPSSTPTPTIVPTPMPSPTPAPTPTPSATPTPMPTPTTTTTGGILPQLQVHYIDVGQGDSILVDYGNIDVLIDGGEESANVANLIKPYVHGDIEAVIATHYHADHIGGLIDVFKDYHVDDAFWNGEVYTTQTYLDWKLAMDNSGASEHIVKRGDVIREGALTFNVLDPIVITDSDPDQDCIVLSLQFGSRSFLFMADDGKPAEDNLLAAGLLQHFDVLKVGHHGSDTASSQEFLNAVKPGIAVYECGVNNQYGFPKPDVIARLKQGGATIYGTDTFGTITVTTNGQSLDVQTERSSTATATALPSSTQTPTPTPTITVPPPTSLCTGATAICNDGTCSYSQHRSGTCSQHGGVREWVNPSPN